MLLIFIWWIQFFAISYLVGFAVLSATSKYLPGIKKRSHFFRVFWIGYAVLISALQYISLFSPIDYITLISLWLFSILILFFFRKDITSGLIGFQKCSHSPFKAAIFAFLAVITVGFLLFSACQDVYQADAYIYHFNAVRWISEYPAVPGLIHLHDRLAFNSSFFLFAALNNIWLFKDAYFHSALSFLVVMTTMQWIAVLLTNRYNWKQKLFVILSAPFLIIAIVLSDRVSSVSTDLSSFLMALVFTLELLDQDRYRLLFLSALSVCVFSFKLIGLTAVFVYLVLVVTKIPRLITKKRGLKTPGAKILIASLALFVLGISGFLARNAILSGWLLYPAPIAVFNLHLPWSIPLADVQATKDITTHFARTMSPGATMGFFEWLWPWLGKWKSYFEILLLFTGIGFFISNICVPSLRKMVRSFKAQYFSVALYGALSLAIWFYGAPDMRLGRAYFWIFFAISSIPLLLFLKQQSNLKMFSACSFLIFFVLSFVFFNNYWHALVKMDEPGMITLTKPHPWPVEKITINDDNPPLEVYVPLPVRRHPWCGNSPLPCAQDYKSLVVNRVRQRVPGDLSKGFIRDFAMHK